MNLLKINEAITYIEENLTCEINMNEVGEIAGCSAFHFRKVFIYLTDMNLNTYIKNRRMTLASYDLQSSDVKIIDLAEKYGYESTTAFNRAFKNVHGVAPSKIRHKNVSLNYHEPITLNIEITGNRQFTYKIEKKEDFRIIGVKEKYKVNIEENFKSIPNQWFKAMITGKIKKLLNLNNEVDKTILGVSVFDDENTFDYYIATKSNMELPRNFYEFTIPEGEYAVFECIGAVPKALQELQRNIIRDWLPSSGYEYADLPDVEVYFEGDRNNADYKCEVWLPVIKKN